MALLNVSSLIVPYSTIRTAAPFLQLQTARAANVLADLPNEHSSVSQTALGGLGTLGVSRTFPALCTAEASSSALSTHTLSAVRLTTIDYHGQRRRDGGDPVTVSGRGFEV